MIPIKDGKGHFWRSEKCLNLDLPKKTPDPENRENNDC